MLNVTRDNWYKGCCIDTLAHLQRIAGGGQDFFGHASGGGKHIFQHASGGGKCFFNVIQLKNFGGATRHQDIYINELISVFLGFLECGSQNK